MFSRPIDIDCPDCGHLAMFEEPFEFRSLDDRSAEERPCHQWGGWLVVERYPTQFPWIAPTGSHQFLRGGGGGGGGYPLYSHGLVLCSHCHANRKHKLTWPRDAHWQWAIRGQVLWAWDRHHAAEILAFVRLANRPSRRSPGLRHIPSHFLSAKVRPDVVRRIEASLAGAEIESR